DAENSAFDGLPLRLLSAEQLDRHESAVPVFDLKVAAGAFSDEQLPTGEAWAELPSHIRPGPDLFVTRVIGESMNRRIPNGAWCLFRFNPGGTRNGKIVLVSSRDIQDSETGERYTIKRYFSEKTVDAENELVSTVISLRPESMDNRFQPIVLHANEEMNVRVVAEFLQVID
ncbi:MAG: S24 family peptidase, partial [Oceanococcaceae bacterium]